MAITFQPVEMETASDDTDGRLVFSDGRLVAVLVRLANGIHESDQGAWFLEAGFGRCFELPRIFADLTAAEVWVRDRLAGRN